MYAMFGSLANNGFFKKINEKLKLSVPETRPEGSDIYGPFWIAVTLIVETMFVGFFDNNLGTSSEEEVKVTRVSSLIFSVFFW